MPGRIYTGPLAVIRWPLAVVRPARPAGGYRRAVGRQLADVIRYQLAQ